MLDHSFVIHIAENLYGFRPHTIEALPSYTFDWRGIFRLYAPNQPARLLRLLRVPDAANALSHIATALSWLEQQGYPAPRVYPTPQHQPVGTIDGWAALLLSFVEGEVLAPAAADLGMLGDTLGRLHRLAPDHTPTFAPSRCHPTVVQETTEQQLLNGLDRAPPLFQPLAAALHADTQRLRSPTSDLCLTHGDCWYQNAIKTASGAVVLIDWDCAGIGAPLLDLGYLLLTSHYDLTRPLEVQPDAAKIEAILRGYQRQCTIPPPEYDLMRSAVRFALAYHLGNYVEEHAQLRADDPILQKIHARFNATEHIAEIALKHLT